MPSLQCSQHHQPAKLGSNLVTHVDSKNTVCAGGQIEVAGKLFIPGAEAGTAFYVGEAGTATP